VQQHRVGFELDQQRCDPAEQFRGPLPLAPLLVGSLVAGGDRCAAQAADQGRDRADGALGDDRGVHRRG
jgi:hypothetical protein